MRLPFFIAPLGGEKEKARSDAFRSGRLCNGRFGSRRVALYE